ncbi:MAG: DUF3576 domain-containing protein [Aestuariivita sp.]|nr:DUF3576 domain-containing protein [Aestuariivita sp.]
MTFSTTMKSSCLLFFCLSLVGCGSSTSENFTDGDQASNLGSTSSRIAAGSEEESDGTSIWDLFGPDRSDQTVAVNRYLWSAALEVLEFLPINTIDPFTGIISTDYGTPPGGTTEYRATVHITDPALEARALRVALVTRRGPVTENTTRAVEDAILARARQMRIADSRF